MSIDERLALEVTSLSTKLVTAVAKLLELEENVLHLHKELAALRATVTRLTQYQEWYRAMLPKYLKVQDELRATREAKRVAEAQNATLQAEVEDLTASLFNEANEMVSNALRETFNFKVKNRKLYEEIDEKQTIIDDLQDQLRHLKEMFAQIEDQHRASKSTTPHLESSATFEPASPPLPLAVPLFSPLVGAVRLDLNNYNHEFKAFVYAVSSDDFTFDLATLKTLRYFKRIWTEELEPACVVPTLPNATLINRWQKGRSFWSCVVEGRAMIEPVKGINEVFKRGAHGGTHSNTNSIQNTPESTPGKQSGAPVAIQDACSFCGELREDTLEHLRLYWFKLLNVQAHHLASDDDLIAAYALCNYCLIKMRHICDFFAKLRLVHANVYKLRRDRSFEEYAYTSTMGFKRNSVGHKEQRGLTGLLPELMNSSVAPIELDSQEEAKIVKIYMTLAVARAKIFWNKYGFWDTERDVTEVALDDMHNEVFGGMLGKSQGVKGEDEEAMESEEVRDRKVGEDEKVKKDEKVKIDEKEDEKKDEKEDEKKYEKDHEKNYEKEDEKEDEKEAGDEDGYVEKENLENVESLLNEQSGTGVHVIRIDELAGE